MSDRTESAPEANPQNQQNIGDIAGRSLRAQQVRTVDGRPGRLATCAQCGVEFVARVESNPCRGKFCSARCRNRQTAKRRLRQTVLPESDPKARVRAAGLINMRLRRGTDTKPDSCSLCGRQACRLDGHHPDYAKPDEVAWLCRSCHMKAHRNPEINERCKALVTVVPATRRAEGEQ